MYFFVDYISRHVYIYICLSLILWCFSLFMFIFVCILWLFSLFFAYMHEVYLFICDVYISVILWYWHFRLSIMFRFNLMWFRARCIIIKVSKCFNKTTQLTQEHIKAFCSNEGREPPSFIFSINILATKLPPHYFPPSSVRGSRDPPPPATSHVLTAGEPVPRKYSFRRTILRSDPHARTLIRTCARCREVEIMKNSTCFN